MKPRDQGASCRILVVGYRSQTGENCEKHKCYLAHLNYIQYVQEYNKCYLAHLSYIQYGQEYYIQYVQEYYIQYVQEYNKFGYVFK